MKPLFVGSLLFVSSFASAQTLRPADLYKLDRPRINTQARAAVTNQPVVHRKSVEIATFARYESQPKPSSSDGYKAPSSSMANDESFSRVHVTVGPEIFLFPQSNTSRWSNELSGLGMNQSIGASVRIDYQFKRAVAVSLTGGYAQWKLIRNYRQNNTEKYDETIQVVRIPIQAGVKLYPWRSLYLLPEAGVNLLMSNVKTAGAHPAPTDQQSSTTPITYGASLGYEFHLGGLLLDLSGRYQILDVKNFNFGAIAPSLTEKVQVGSIRLGIGFNAFRN